MNSRYFMFLSAALLSVSLAACGDDENDPNPNPDPEPVVEENVSGNVSGIWEKNSIINVSGHITVPEGESLTIEEGVTVVFSSNGVGASHTPIEFVVDGDLYCLGTEENPVTLTVAENERTPENAFEGLWGGIIATDKCEEILLDTPARIIDDRTLV